VTAPTDEPDDAPATWENVVVGKAKELAGHAVGNQELEEEGETQVEVAEEVNADYKRRHESE
jgi:uncharacterized protein YjbJ (UPF0337 family)